MYDRMGTIIRQEFFIKIINSSLKKTKPKLISNLILSLKTCLYKYAEPKLITNLIFSLKTCLYRHAEPKLITNLTFSWKTYLYKHAEPKLITNLTLSIKTCLYKHADCGTQTGHKFNPLFKNMTVVCRTQTGHKFNPLLKNLFVACRQTNSDPLPAVYPCLAKCLTQSGPRQPTYWETRGISAGVFLLQSLPKSICAGKSFKSICVGKSVYRFRFLPSSPAHSTSAEILGEVSWFSVFFLFTIF